VAEAMTAWSGVKGATMAGTQGRLTLRQIAEAAGVSQPTISKVLNGRGDVSPATRQRVLKLLRDHEYAPRGATNVPHATKHIELTFDALVTPNNLEMMRGVVEAMTSRNIHVAVSLYPPEIRSHLWINELERAGRGGVILVTSRLTKEQQNRLGEADLPVVVIDPINPPDNSIVSVGATNWQGGMSAVEHLIQLGHTRIGIIRGRESVCDTARYHGYVAALTAHGLPLDPQLVERGEFTFDDSIPAATNLLTHPSRPTAIFAANDLTALGIIEAARHLGLRVPDDLSVVGFDDGLLARTASPPLTTVHQPFYDMGVAAAGALTDLIDTGSSLSSRVELATTLIVRESTKAT